jgi:hypothetical protein
MNQPDPFAENGDLIRAFEERPLTGGMKVPDRVLFDLEDARIQAIAAKKHRRSSFPILRSGLLRLAAVLTLLGAITWMFIPRSPPTAHVVITSPGDEVIDTRPTIAWSSKDKPGQKYDVWILPAEGDHLTAPVLFVAKNVASPVAFSQLKPGPTTTTADLQPGTDYRVLVCLADAGRMAGVPVPFRVIASSR